MKTIEWKAPPCWICGRPKKGGWHSAWDHNQEYSLCWFCVGEVTMRFCDYEHEKCGWWKDYTCTRAITLEEMQRLRREIRQDRAGGFKFVKDPSIRQLTLDNREL